MPRTADVQRMGSPLKELRTWAARSPFMLKAVKRLEGRTDTWPTWQLEVRRQLEALPQNRNIKHSYMDMMEPLEVPYGTL